MVFILLLLGGLSVYCLMRSYINKYSWYFCAIIFSLIAALYASFLLISASGNYISVGYILDDFDGRMFLSLIANKINFFTIIRSQIHGALRIFHTAAIQGENKIGVVENAI